MVGREKRLWRWAFSSSQELPKEGNFKNHAKVQLHWRFPAFESYLPQYTGPHNCIHSEYTSTSILLHNELIAIHGLTFDWWYKVTGIYPSSQTNVQNCSKIMIWTSWLLDGLSQTFVQIFSVLRGWIYWLWWCLDFSFIHLDNCCIAVEFGENMHFPRGVKCVNLMMVIPDFSSLVPASGQSFAECLTWGFFWHTHSWSCSWYCNFDDSLTYLSGQISIIFKPPHIIVIIGNTSLNVSCWRLVSMLTLAFRWRWLGNSGLALAYTTSNLMLT